MKVRIAELKSKLSKYVQTVKDQGQRIEVCVRDETVAYLTPAHPIAGQPTPAQAALAQRLLQKGLVLSQPGQITQRILSPGSAGDGLVIGNTVLAERETRDW